MDSSNWKIASGFRGFMCKILKLIGRQSDVTINEVLFYGATDKQQRKQDGLNNLYCIYYLISHASRTIDICVPSLDSDTLAKSLVAVKQRNNVRIKIAIHNSINFNNLQSFSKCGIEVKVIKATVKLEHEFILIDACDDFVDSVAVVGSVDYETTRVNTNRDTTLLTSDTTLAKTLKREFDRVWEALPILKDKGDKNDKSE